jgi:uncharacterized protein
MRLFKRILLGIGVLVAALFAFMYWAGPNMLLTPRRVNWNHKPEDFNLPYERISVCTDDSLVMRGVWVHDSVKGRPTLITLHGIGNCKECCFGRAASLWTAGYNVVLMDLRAHGESGGEYCTYGYYEKRDMQAVVDYLLEQDSTTKIGILGHSLGGAVAMQALAAEPRLQFGIIESTFADYRQIVYDYQQRMFKIPARAIADNSIARAAEKAKFEPDSIRPSEAARRIHQPMLIVHGDADEKIKIEYGRLNFDNLATTDKQWYVVPNGDHSNVARMGGTAYQTVLMQFLKRVAPPTSAVARK